MANHLIHDKFVGAYVYAILIDGVVRYVGKGRRYRAIEHFRKAREINRLRERGEKVAALPFQNRLAKAIRTGLSVSYDVIASGMSDAEAFDREIEEIAKAPAGQLWNLQRGGSDSDPRIMKALWAKPDFRDKVLKSRQTSMYGNAEWRERQRANAVAQWSDPETKRRHFEQHRKLWDDPVEAAKRRDLLRRVWADPEKIEQKRRLVRSQWTPERRAAMAENRRQAWADPAFKARVTAAVKIGRAKRRDLAKASLPVPAVGAQKVQG